MEKDKRALDKMAEWLVCACNEDICGLCIHLEESEWEFAPEDIPEDVEPCRFRRNGGNEACKQGIIDYFGQLPERRKGDGK